jgi:hypothetical protein
LAVIVRHGSAYVSRIDTSNGDRDIGNYTTAWISHRSHNRCLLSSGKKWKSHKEQTEEQEITEIAAMGNTTGKISNCFHCFPPPGGDLTSPPGYAH